MINKHLYFSSLLFYIGNTGSRRDVPAVRTAATAETTAVKKPAKSAPTAAQ
jgi:hypothetical protein